MCRSLQSWQETPAKHSAFIAQELADSACAFVLTDRADAPLFAELAKYLAGMSEFTAQELNTSVERFCMGTRQKRCSLQSSRGAACSAWTSSLQERANMAWAMRRRNRRTRRSLQGWQKRLAVDRPFMAQGLLIRHERVVADQANAPQFTELTGAACSSWMSSSHGTLSTWHEHWRCQTKRLHCSLRN